MNLLGPLPCSTATPSGPRNSSALAVPSRMRSTAIMNSTVIPAVTTPSRTEARNDFRVRRGRAWPHDDQQQRGGPEQAQPGGAPVAPISSISSDGDGGAQLHRTHRGHGHERAVTCLAGCHPRIQRCRTGPVHEVFPSRRHISACAPGTGRCGDRSARRIAHGGDHPGTDGTLAVEQRGGADRDSVGRPVWSACTPIHSSRGSLASATVRSPLM